MELVVHKHYISFVLGLRGLTILQFLVILPISIMQEKQTNSISLLDGHDNVGKLSKHVIFIWDMIKHYIIY